MSRRRDLFFGSSLAGVAALVMSVQLLAAAKTDGWPADGWVSYKVPLQPGQSSPCCFRRDADVEFRRDGCDLEERHGDTSVSADVLRFSGDADPTQLRLFVSMHEGRPQEVRAFGADCPIRASQAVTDVGAMSTEASIDWLLPFATESSTGSGRGGLSEDATMAVAMHAGEPADAALLTLANQSRAFEARKPAVFWLGQRHSDRAARALARIASDDPSADMRKHAVFSLSQSDASFAYDRLRDIAKADVSADVRGETLFWMAQTHAASARQDILEALRRESSAEAREQAVFALSQLEEGAAAALIDVVEGDYSDAMRKQALFWLAQSDTTDAQRYLERIFDGGGR